MSSSIRAQLAGGADSAQRTEDLRLADALKERMVADNAADARERPSKVRGSRIVGCLLAALGAGGACAFLAGSFRAQTVAGLANWDLQFLSFAMIVCFLPPLLFIAAGFAISRAQTMHDAAVRLASVSERMTAADDGATGNAQRV